MIKKKKKSCQNPATLFHLVKHPYILLHKPEVTLIATNSGRVYFNRCDKPSPHYLHFSLSSEKTPREGLLNLHAYIHKYIPVAYRVNEAICMYMKHRHQTHHAPNQQTLKQLITPPSLHQFHILHLLYHKYHCFVNQTQS